MKHAFFSLLATSAAVSAFGMVDISNATVSQGFGSRDVTVSYDIVSTDEPTTPVYIGFDVLTNGVSIGLENIKTLEGDIHQDSTVKAPFTAGTGYSFVWKARKDWPDHRIKDAQVKITAYTKADFEDMCDYLCVDLSAGASAANYPVTYSMTGPDTTKDAWKKTQLWMRRIRVAPKTTFQIGTPDTSLCKSAGSKTQNVSLVNDYWIAVVEMTQGQRNLIDGTAYSQWAECSVHSVSYKTIRGNNGWITSKTPSSSSILGKLAARTGLNFDLPTGVQWEYACRAGTTTDLNTGKNVTSTTELCPNLDEVAWCHLNAKGTIPWAVGLKKANAWGLYDMHGLMSEFCLERNRGENYDWVMQYNGNTEPFVDRAHKIDGGAWTEGDGSHREIRGGHWKCGPGGAHNTTVLFASGYSGNFYWMNANGTADWLGFRPAITKNNELNKYSWADY